MGRGGKDEAELVVQGQARAVASWCPGLILGDETGPRAGGWASVGNGCCRVGRVLPSAPCRPQCPWTAGLWCCQPLATSRGAPARRRTPACWSCRARCAPWITCSSAPSSAAARATASAWTAACAAPSRTARCPAGPRGPRAPTPARPRRPRPHWEPLRPPAAVTGWRAGRPGWDPASRS